MTKVLFPGSFDPITKGHMNIIEQASNLFDEVIIAIMNNPEKTNYFFSRKERIELVKEIYKSRKNINIVSSENTTVDLAQELDCKILIRGLRDIIDFEYEFKMSQINKDISNDEINTICIFTDPIYKNISSSTVKQIFDLNKSISKYVDPIVEERMITKKLTKQKGN